MSKEEVLLEVVLDNFANIMEVLNATKDIENYLIKLKLNKKRGFGVILEKTKNLVDSLYDHSAKVKQEFYKYYDALENIPSEKDQQSESSDSIPEVNVDSAVDENIPNLNEELNSNSSMTCNDNTHENESHSAANTEGKENTVENAVVENELDNTEVRENMEVENCDVPAEEKNDSDISNLEDPLKDTGNSDVTESSTVPTSKETNDAESLIDDSKNCGDESIKEEPKALIRLVDLSKLIDPKPKKSVKFDSSVIILTSSDEEVKTPKKNCDTKDQNGVLKSALKNSTPSKNTENSTKTKKGKHKKTSRESERRNKKQLRSRKSDRNKNNSSDSEQSNESSSDSEVLGNRVNKVKIQNNKIQNKQAPTDKHQISSDSDVQEVCLENDTESDCESHSKKNKHLTDAQTKKSRKSDNKDTPSDSDKNIASTDSENSDTSKHDVCSPDNVRKSIRIYSSNSLREERKQNLRKIFKRKPTKSGRSDFEIVQSKDDDIVSNSDSETTNKKKTSTKKKDYLVQQHLSASSSSEDERDPTIKNKSKTNTSSHKSCAQSILPKDVNDKKFQCEVYIPLPRIECSQLKDVYLRNKEILEIRSLTTLNFRKSCKRTKNDSASSSEAEKPKTKKSKNISNKKTSDPSGDDQSSDDEPLIKSAKSSTSAETNDEEKTVENTDEKMADIIMDNLKECSEDKKSEGSSSEIEEEKEKSDSQSKANEINISEEDAGKSSLNEEMDKDKEPSDDKIEKEIENTKESSADENDKKSDKESDDEQIKSSKNWRKDKLLTTKIDSTDSEEEFSKYCKKKEQSKEELSSSRKGKKKLKNVIVSDSDESDKEKKESSSDENKSSEEKSSSSNESEKEEIQKKATRRRIKRTKDSSSGSDDDKSTRKQIRRVIDKDSLSETTKQAEAEEKERKARIAEKQKKYNNIFESKTDSKVEKVVLDYDEKEKKELLSVNKKIVKKLKPHQSSGIQFMWDASFESLERTKSTKGSGCILAHCMGLGKTLQVVALAHTLLTHTEKTGVDKIMVVCPINTVLNWKAEFKMWMPNEDDFEVHELVSCKQNYERQFVVQEWHREGGVLIIGYHMFRNLSNPDNKRISKKMRMSFQEGLVDPGPDLVVCDEGHLLKNEKTHLSIAMNRIKTARRIVLTGTPLQNNLKEYWCMVQFIKPNLLGTYKEYLNRFVNPITNGQYTDSTQHDILLMRKRSHVLHKLLDGVVQRRDYAVLAPYLPPKHEYVLFISLTETQVKLYENYMLRFARQSNGSNRTSFLFTDFQELQRICTHPRVLLDKSKEKREKFDDEEESEGSLKDFIDDGDASSESTSGSSSSNSDSENSSSGKKKSKPQQRVRITRAQAAQQRENNEESEPEVEVVRRKEWWQEFCDGEELDNINHSGKLFLLFQILKECEEIGDKILVFSQSLYALNCIEYFLEKIDEATQAGNTEKIGHTGSWAIGLDYFRLDGSSSCDNRATWCDMFNNPTNTRARLFLISTKAGGLGINLVAANRVIIFDVSWNPSHDIQSIYRVYRFGQTKPCYIYRFVTYGTMEMKIYERQVTKQAISKRVIDEQQIDRHYNQNDLQELYKCDLQPSERPIPLVPNDVLLGEMLQKYDKTIFKYHLHQSLLENKTHEGLNEEERKAAWEEFENEKVLRKNPFSAGFGGPSNAVLNAHAIEAALTNIVRKDNPTWSDVQIKGIIPALVQQLQVQLSEGDTTMYARVQQEMQIMQALHAQKLKEVYYQQQVMRMIQQQQEQAKMLGNMNIDPAQLTRVQANMLNNLLSGSRQGGPSNAAPRRPLANDIIELND